MKIFYPPFIRATILASVAMVAAPTALRAENPLSTISGRIKTGVSSVGSAIKKTAKAAKNIVTPGKASEAKPPAAPASTAPKKTPAASTSPTSKTKRPATAPTSAPPKPGAGGDAKPRAKPSAAPASVTSTSTSKSKAKAKPRPEAADSASKAKARKKETSDVSAEPENSQPASKTKKGAPSDDPQDNPAGVPVHTASPDQGGDHPPAAAGERQSAEEFPFGTPAFGRKGFVYSPFAPDQGLIDVRTVGAGAKVRCPYTGKVFRVP